jgi:hypothetical protein
VLLRNSSPRAVSFSPSNDIVQTFKSRAKFEDYLAEQVRQGGFAESSARVIATTVSREFQTPIDEPGTRVILPRLGFAIRDDDLDLLKTVGDVLQACIAGGFIMSATTKAAAVPAAVASIYLALVHLGRNLLRKGARLERRDAILLCALKSSPQSLTTAALLARVGGLAEPFTEAELSDRLQRLLKTRVGSGETVALVAEDADHRWATAGI